MPHSTLVPQITQNRRFPNASMFQHYRWLQAGSTQTNKQNTIQTAASYLAIVSFTQNVKEDHVFRPDFPTSEAVQSRKGHIATLATSINSPELLSCTRKAKQSHKSASQGPDHFLVDFGLELCTKFRTLVDQAEPSVQAQPTGNVWKSSLSAALSASAVEGQGGPCKGARVKISIFSAPVTALTYVTALTC